MFLPLWMTYWNLRKTWLFSDGREEREIHWTRISKPYLPSYPYGYGAGLLTYLNVRTSTILKWAFSPAFLIYWIHWWGADSKIWNTCSANKSYYEKHWPLHYLRWLLLPHIIVNTMMILPRNSVLIGKPCREWRNSAKQMNTNISSLQTIMPLQNNVYVGDYTSLCKTVKKSVLQLLFR